MPQAFFEPSQKVLDWQHLTGADFQKLDPAKCIIFVTCSPLEVHGPHLPVCTDSLESEGFISNIAEQLQPKLAPDLTFIKLPPIYVATDLVAHRGSINFRSSTIVHVLSDLGRSLSKQGFKDIWISNFHGGPRHFLSLDIACHKSNKKYKTRMVSIFSLLLKQLTGGSTDLSNVLSDIPGLSKEILKGDSHGGVIETSLMLYLLKEKVSQNYTTLKQNSVSHKLDRLGKKPLQAGKTPTMLELLRGFREQLRYYNEETYAGHPARATPELGQQILERLSGYAVEALLEIRAGKVPLAQSYSPIWPLRWLFSNRLIGWLFEKYAGVTSKIW